MSAEVGQEKSLVKEISRKRKSGKNKKQKQLGPEDDGLKRMCKMATIFQSPEFQSPKKKKRPIDTETPFISQMKPDDAPTKKRGRKTEQKQVTFEDETQPERKRKTGPYDPVVYQFVEETRAAVETEKAIQSISPAEEGEIVMDELELSSNHLASPSKVDFMICPYHILPLDNCHSSKGWNYRKCQQQPCILFCGSN